MDVDTKLPVSAAAMVTELSCVGALGAHLSVIRDRDRYIGSTCARVYQTCWYLVCTSVFPHAETSDGGAVVTKTACQAMNWVNCAHPAMNVSVLLGSVLLHVV